ncbi:MAG: glucosaminidase domain-containing protein [Alphaproteobacteria bacterium]|nr:glucosaminidase domain-containing protein [Alphaproteobacteria bacterium]
MMRCTRLIAFVLGALLCAIQSAAAQGVIDKAPVTQISVTSAAELDQVFTKARYTLANVRQFHVAPPLFVRRLPRGLADVLLAEKESLFIRLVIPLVTKANKDILAQRRRLLALHNQQRQNQPIDDADRKWLLRLASLYAVEPGDLDTLVTRVDIVPAALAIAQAIIESGWGTGRLAIASNGLFGQHALPGSHGTVTAKRDRNVAVAAFPNLLHGAYAYMFNLNTARTYRTLRAVRAKARAAGKRPSGYDMAIGLEHYSGRGMAYVDELRSLIRRHRLNRYEALRLAPDGFTKVKHTAQ